jgi:hypothetical protein
MNQITEINGIPVYQDKYMDDDKFLVMYKSKSAMNPGIVHVNTEHWNKTLSECDGGAIEQEEVDRILKMKKNKNLDDVKAIICKEINEIIIENIIKILEKQFK